jgi:hypothetical protein
VEQQRKPGFTDGFGTDKSGILFTKMENSSNTMTEGLGCSSVEERMLSMWKALSLMGPNNCKNEIKQKQIPS